MASICNEAGRPRPGCAAREGLVQRCLSLRALTLATGLAAYLGAPLAAWALPTPAEVRAAHRPSDVQLLDRHGAPLHRLRTDFSVRRGAWLPLTEVSPVLREAMVLSEDRRFWAHSGVDWRAVPAAAWGNLFNQRTRGASTLTMQLAGLLDADWRAGPSGRSVAQKIGQAAAALELERHWRKHEILEAYLNLVPFRGEIVGIDALSRSLFGKSADALDAREAAVAAALVRAPNARPSEVARRACGVWRLLQPAAAATPRAAAGAASAAGDTDCAALDAFATATLARRDWPASEGLAPHLARRLLAASGPRAPAGVLNTPVRLERPMPGGLPVLRTTLDASLQRLAVQTLAQQLRELRGRQVEDGAVLVLDNASGEVRAWVGSSGVLSASAEVDGVLAPRQAGSTLKPFLYAQALAERRLTAASLIEDAPTQLPTAGGLYIPQNYDRQFKGWVSVRTALGASLNIPAVRTLAMVGPDAFAERLAQLGLPLAQPGAHYGNSLALGSAEVSLLHLTNAYRSLANGARPGALRWLPRARGEAVPASGAPAFDPAAAFVVADILSDANARVRTFGPDSVLQQRFWAAVKTGTSKDMRDNWAIGFTPRHTVGVWVGNASGAPMHAVSGTSGAAPVWATLMQALHRTASAAAPAAPAGVQRLPVRFAPALEAARAEWFLPGTFNPRDTSVLIAATDRMTLDYGEKSSNSAVQGLPEAARILSPAEGTILALDPDIAPRHQRLVLRADATEVRWQIDGRALGRGPEVHWLPLPGRHHVTLHDAAGRLLDERRIEVRGAGLARAVAAATPPGRSARQ